MKRCTVPRARQRDTRGAIWRPQHPLSALSPCEVAIQLGVPVLAAGCMQDHGGKVMAASLRHHVWAWAPVDVTVTGRFATAIYDLESTSEECVGCDAALEAAFSTRLCTELGLSNCSRARTECVKGTGRPFEMDVLLFLPTEVSALTASQDALGACGSRNCCADLVQVWWRAHPEVVAMPVLALTPRYTGLFDT
eukprot:1145572-Pelagomonas_calceolata.AAC.5